MEPRPDESTLHSLGDVKDLEDDASIKRRYLIGRFGIPESTPLKLPISASSAFSAMRRGSTIRRASRLNDTSPRLPPSKATKPTEQEPPHRHVERFTEASR